MAAEAEYATLRQEILDHMRAKSEVEVGYITLSVLILAYPLTDVERLNPSLISPYHYLPVLVCIVATLIMTQRDRTVRGIASYLMVFHEEKLGAGRWESALHHVRTTDSKPLKALQKDIWLGETSTRAFVPLGIVLLSLFLRGLHKQPWPLPDMILFGACVFIQTWLAWVWRRVFLQEEVQSAVALWRKVASALPPPGQPASTNAAGAP